MSSLLRGLLAATLLLPSLARASQDELPAPYYEAVVAGQPGWLVSVGPRFRW